MTGWWKLYLPEHAPLPSMLHSLAHTMATAVDKSPADSTRGHSVDTSRQLPVVLTCMREVKKQPSKAILVYACGHGTATQSTKFPWLDERLVTVC